MRAWRHLTLCLGLMAPIGTPAQESSFPPDSPCIPKQFEANSFTVCRLDTRKQELRLFWTDARGIPLRSFERLAAALGSDESKVQFAFNAGMFDSGGTPVGLFVERGVERVSLNERAGTGNFYMKPNGVFWVDQNGSLGVTNTQQYTLRSQHPLWATQSGPILVLDGSVNPNIAPNGPSKFIRNGVGVFDAHTAFFAISDGPVSFGRFARFFKDALSCENALYLDGAVSSVWIPAIHRRDQAYLLGPIVAVSAR